MTGVRSDTQKQAEVELDIFFFFLEVVSLQLLGMTST